jgi:hypothetical protein
MLYSQIENNLSDLLSTDLPLANQKIYTLEEQIKSAVNLGMKLDSTGSQA